MNERTFSENVQRKNKQEGAQNESPLSEAYALVGARDIVELSEIYDREDQRLFKSGQWDYDNPDLLTNRIKAILAGVNPTKLTETEREWRQEMLWFWYHHAISCAIWKKKDKEKAKLYAGEAIK